MTSFLRSPAGGMQEPDSNAYPGSDLVGRILPDGLPVVQRVEGYALDSHYVASVSIGETPEKIRYVALEVLRGALLAEILDPLRASDARCVSFGSVLPHSSRVLSPAQYR